MSDIPEDKPMEFDPPVEVDPTGALLVNTADISKPKPEDGEQPPDAAPPENPPRFPDEEDN